MSYNKNLYNQLQETIKQLNGNNHKIINIDSIMRQDQLVPLEKFNEFCLMMFEEFTDVIEKLRDLRLEFSNYLDVCYDESIDNINNADTNINTNINNNHNHYLDTACLYCTHFIEEFLNLSDRPDGLCKLTNENKNKDDTCNNFNIIKS